MRQPCCISLGRPLTTTFKRQTETEELRTRNPCRQATVGAVMKTAAHRMYRMPDQQRTTYTPGLGLLGRTGQTELYSVRTFSLMLYRFIYWT